MLSSQKNILNSIKIHSMKSNPLVTIITVAFNADKTIEKTIQSVLNQSYKNIEYIIVDGASSDKTVDIINRYDDYISYWISEPDHGIYDAMNKGLAKATGEIIAIINADDWYEENAVELSVETIIKHNADYSYASILHHAHKKIGRISPIEYGSFTKKAFFEMPYPHISAFIKREVYEEVGFFDTSFKIAGDHDLALKVILHGYRGVEVNQVIAHALADGVSSDFKANMESFKVARQHAAPLFVSLLKLTKQFIVYIAMKYLPTEIIKKLQKLKKSRFL